MTGTGAANLTVSGRQVSGLPSMKYPAAYVRRSVASRNDPGDISREFQTDAVRKLAGDDADRLHIIDGDWGRSAATDKTGKRLAFLGLMEAIERGEVSALYAYSADRLARSVEWAARLLNACRRAGVPIITTQGRANPGDDSAALLFHVLAATNESTLSGMQAKARASIERRRQRNIEAGRKPTYGMGKAPYGEREGDNLQAVIEAFREAGSYQGALRLLNQRGIPAYSGGKWNSPKGIHDIIERTIPNEVPRHPGKGARTATNAGLARLLNDSFGHLLTPGRYPEGLRYKCQVATKTDPTLTREKAERNIAIRKAYREGMTGPAIAEAFGIRKSRVYQIIHVKNPVETWPEPLIPSMHSVKSVAERTIYEWLGVELERELTPLRELAAETAANQSAVLAELDREQENLTRAMISGKLPDHLYDKLAAEIQGKREAVKLQGLIHDSLPDAIDLWNDHPATVNRYLRTIIDYIQLDERMRPVKVVWSMPALRETA